MVLQVHVYDCATGIHANRDHTQSVHMTDDNFIED